MKKLLPILIALTCYFTAFAQEKKFELGAEGGICFSFLRGSIYINKESGLISPVISIFFQYNYKENISFKIPLTYSILGSSNQFVAIDRFAPTRYFEGPRKFRYLTVPCLFHYNSAKKINSFFNAGPFISFLISEVAGYNYNLTGANSELKGTDFYQRVNAGISFGGGISCSIKKKISFSLEIRNDLGLINVLCTNLPIDYEKNWLYGSPVKTNATNFLLGFAYHFIKRKDELRSNSSFKI